MRLTQIKLAGFKSFVEPTVIPTPSQLVGVVGPNGCGKSNIIDAVRWVLGESKASELRGESMQDVIFNGSGQRKPAARASVELVFDNAQGRATGQWSTYAEISVRRILTRDGTSSYLINNQQVRRRDIHDIFLGTGLGARGYAIIGQGMINRLIEARPEELRVFLEEAAGVSRYKERRRETENRLEDTRENLLRLDDILRELEAQLEKLEAQAEVARHYRELQADGERKQHALWLLREQQARQDQSTRFLAIEQAQTELEGAVARLRAGESALETRRQAHYAAGDAVHAAQARVYEAGALVSRLEAEIRHVADSRNRVQVRRDQLHAQLSEWQEQQAHCSAQKEEVLGDIEEAAARLEVLHGQLEQVQSGLPDYDQQVRQSAQEREQLRVTLARLEQELALVAQSQRDADRQIQALQLRRERIDQEHKGLNVPDPIDLRRLEGEAASARELLQQAHQQLTQAEARLPVCDHERTLAAQALRRASDEAARLEARLSALVKLQEDVQKKGSLQPWLKEQGLDTLSRLWQKVHIESGWETALEAVLRERLTGIEVRSLDHVTALAAHAPPARLAFYQLPVPGPAQPGSLDLEPLMAKLRMADPELRAVLSGWLHDVYVVPDLVRALALREQLPPWALLVVSQGHCIDRHGVRFYAPDSEQAGLLARQQDIENLRRELKAHQLIADQAQTDASRADAAWQQASSAVIPARQRVSELTQRLHTAELEQTRMVQLAEQAGDRAARLQEDLADLNHQIETLSATRHDAEMRFESLDEQVGQYQMQVEDALQAAEALAEKANAVRQQVRDLERSVQEAEFAERTLRARLSELDRTRDLAIEQARRAQVELDGLQGELFELDASAAQAGLQEALEERARHEEALSLARQSLDQLTASLKQADEERLELERSIEPLRARITELQLQEQASRLSVEQYSEQLDAHQVDRAALQAWLAQAPAEWGKASWLQSEVQRVSRAIEALGPVNLAALDELNTARERKGFLDAQHTDLTTAIQTLEDAIRKIDRETRELLQSTFNAVNQHFGELFPRLFGGGEARLIITGDEILDAGVQVMAQPPGKRNSTIHLLSGGEKALTATALVFALFKLNPAPFCLLDEVDAPLDDANTERYANLVRSMSDQTQFLFISHNKIAMQMARQLVGVTMQEQGVSRIVAVDIDAALHMAQT